MHDIAYASGDGSGLTVLFAVEPRMFLDSSDRLTLRSLAPSHAADLEAFARELVRARDRREAEPTGLPGLITAMLRERGETAPPTALERARLELERHFDSALYLRHIAELAAVRPETLIRRFQREVGMTPMQYRHCIRLDEASEMAWQQPAMRLEAIAAACGISHRGHFHHSFRQSYGTTPGHHRYGTVRRARVNTPPHPRRRTSVADPATVAMKTAMIADNIGAFRALHASGRSAMPKPLGSRLGADVGAHRVAGVGDDARGLSSWLLGRPDSPTAFDRDTAVENIAAIVARRAARPSVSSRF